MIGNDTFLDHIAIAVNNLDESQKIYEHLGFKFKPQREVVESQKVITAFADVDTHAHIELLMPTENAGPIYEFLNKKGQGIHHLSFLVPDIYKKQEELKNLGYKLLYDEPKKGANKKLINFIHPKSAGGVLIEISQHDK